MDMKINDTKIAVELSELLFETSKDIHNGHGKKIENDAQRVEHYVAMGIRYEQMLVLANKFSDMRAMYVGEGNAAAAVEVMFRQAVDAHIPNDIDAYTIQIIAQLLDTVIFISNIGYTEDMERVSWVPWRTILSGTDDIEKNQ